MNKRVTRRMAMAIGTAGATAAMFRRPWLFGADTVGTDEEVETLRHLILALFREQGAAAAIGLAYLADRPEERDTGLLLAGVLDADVGGASPVRRLAAADLHAWLRQRNRADFAAGRTVWVEGWLLAQTEARLYALAAMA